MHGVWLKELSSTDMLDVLHYMFEDDALSSPSGEHLEAKEKVRISLYKELYNRDYKYASAASRGGDFIPQSMQEEELTADEIPVPVDPMQRSSSPFPTKRYIPPTQVNENSIKPFGTNIDSPLG